MRHPADPLVPAPPVTGDYLGRPTAPVHSYGAHMPQRTLYDVLMLHPSADVEVITVVYRALAKRHHPDHDHTPEAHARMAEINEAYATLSDPRKRARYDETLKILERASSGRTLPGAMSMKYADGSWSVRDPGEQPPDSPYGDAGPPPRYPPATGATLSFGRYRGWTVSQVEYHDRNYLEWLQRTPAGRAYAHELKSVLGRSA